MGDRLLKRVTFTLLILVLAAIGDRHWFRIESAMAAVVSERVDEREMAPNSATCADKPLRTIQNRTIQIGPEFRAKLEASVGLAKRARATAGVTS